MYDPGPIQGALAALEAGDLTPDLVAAARRVKLLYGRARTGALPASAGERSPAVGLQTLGHLAWHGKDPMTPLPSRRVVELLLRLLWAGNAGLSREGLAEAIWPEADPTDQANRLRVTLHALRRWLAASWGDESGLGPRVMADRLTVSLTGEEGLGWDVLLLKREIESARRSHEAGEIEVLGRHARNAIELYPGALLPDPVWYETFFYEREKLEREHVGFIEWVASVLGPEHVLLPPLLERAVRTHPTDESLPRLWLESLTRQGRKAEARKALQECAALFEAQMDLKPPEEWLRAVEGGGHTS